jgi:hypothetical protein
MRKSLQQNWRVTGDQLAGSGILFNRDGSPAECRPRTSTHGESLLVQHGAIGAPHFHTPVTVVHGLAAVSTKPFGRIRPNRQAH